MQSIIPKMLIWLFGSVVFALVGCMVTAHIVATRRVGHNDFFAATQQLQADTASQILERDGPEAVSQYLNRLNESFRAHHHLVDNRDRDVSDQKNLSELVNRSKNGDWMRELLTGHIVLERMSADGRHRLLIEISPPFGPWEILPYFVWVFVVILAIGYALAFHLVHPLELLRNAVEEFGKGKLDARVCLNRLDEFGELGREFDKMAQRIEALVTAERLLLQDISHELRSPLTRLRFALELAKNTDDRATAFQRLEKEVCRLTELVEQLLQLTRAEGDITARNIADVLLYDLISDSIDDFQLEADAKQCVLAKRLKAHPIIRGDYELIRRAIDNVLSNAVRHAPPHSEITIDLNQDGQTATICIRDHGSGVPEEFLIEIFKPFRRVDVDRDRDTGGLGLGLSIAQRAVELHQGTITARNADQGLEIVFAFPTSEINEKLVRIREL